MELKSQPNLHFLDLMEPSSLLEKRLYRQNCQYFVPNSNYKIYFFQNFKPPSPLFHQKAEPH